MSSRHDRQLRKMQLLDLVRFHRAEISQLSEIWVRKMQPVDAVWETLYRLRTPVMLGGGWD